MEKTGKQLTRNMKLKSTINPTVPALKELCQWVQEKYPSIYLEAVLDEEDNTARGLYFQYQEMKTAFERFPGDSYECNP